jgi:hypothetical protein
MMAEAPGHKLGQIIGNELEAAVEPLLRGFAEEHELYLDKKGPRLTRPRKKKLVWEDGLGNTHELDYVLERGGTASKIGVPAAFVETAWRRYTKHSRNKVQEIQGAILPLLQTYEHSKPFAGAVLAGVFTDGSLNQLRSNGFSVVYIPAAIVSKVFSNFGIDISAEESTSDEYVQEQIARYSDLDQQQLQGLREALRQAVSDQLQEFTAALTAVVVRRIESVSVLPLHGTPHTFEDIQAAIEMIRSYDGSVDVARPFIRFEVIVRYSNGDRIVANYSEAERAAKFLESFL